MWNFEELSEKYTAFQLDKLRNHKPVMLNCKHCGELFDAQSYHFRPTAIYPYIKETCSKECTNQFAGTKNKKVFKPYVCGGCNQFFIPRKGKPHQQFCNKTCRGISLTGKKRPEVQQWVHKIKPPRNSVSVAGTKWLDQFELTHREHCLVVSGRTVRVDGFNAHTNTVYEYLGSFWHGNPKIYQPEDINPVNGKTFKQLYDETMSRIELLERNGYTVIVEWSER